MKKAKILTISLIDLAAILGILLALNVSLVFSQGREQITTPQPPPGSHLGPNPAITFAEAIVAPDALAALVGASLTKGVDGQVGVFTQPVQGFPTNGTSWGILSSGNVTQIGLVAGSPFSFVSHSMYGFAGETNTIPSGCATPGTYSRLDTVRVELTFTVPPGATTLTFDWKFGTEENPDYTFSGYQDHFNARVVAPGVDQNIARLPNGCPLSVSNASFFTPGTWVGDSVYNAVTFLQTATFNVVPFVGQQIKLIFEVSDASDPAYNSAAFIDNVTFGVAPVNQSPVAEANGPYLGNEGSPIIFDGSGSYDPDGTIVLYEWDLDGDGEYDDATGINPTFTWGDDYTGTIGLKVTDDGGLTDTDSTTVTVNNVAPTVDAGLDVANYSGQTHQLTATFTDPGMLDTHTATIDWGDGSLPEAAVVVTGTVTGSHVYFLLGSYTITVTVFDDDGGVGLDSLVKTVAPLPVQIDIKPGSFPNSINLGNKGNVPVGVFTGTYQGISFDATTIDRNSLEFAGALDLGIGKSPQDLDADEDMDMVFHFATQKLNLTATSIQATLMGKTTAGIYFEGSDSVRIVPPK